MAKYKNIVISPHIDDAFFSLGGMLLRDMRHDQKIVDVFSISKFQMSSKKLSAKQVTEIRRKEEKANARKIRAKVDFLPFKDTSLRDEKYDARIAGMIKKSLMKYSREGARIFFPLGIGGHGDHRLLAKIGMEIAQEGKRHNVYFYEDLPYAIKTTAIFSIAKMFRLAGRKQASASLNMNALKAQYVGISCLGKLKLCETYVSQTNKAILTSIAYYGLALGHFVSCKERVWKFDSR